MSGDEPPKSKSKRKSKGAAHVFDDIFDTMLESALKSANRAASSSKQKSMAEAASGWSNDNDGNPPSVIRRGTRRAAEEIIATGSLYQQSYLLLDIPTIPMEEADGDDTIDMSPQIAVAPEFSVNQIASFKEIEKEFSRERGNQYINPKIDIGILYHNLHLQEEINIEDQKSWDWDKVFVEIRNTITNLAIEL